MLAGSRGLNLSLNPSTTAASENGCLAPFPKVFQALENGVLAPVAQDLPGPAIFRLPSDAALFLLTGPCSRPEAFILEEASENKLP